MYTVFRNIFTIGVIGIIFLIPSRSKAQVVQGAYMQEIKSHLDMLSDSIAPGLNQMVNLSFSNISIQSFLRTVAESHSLNVQIDPAIDIKVTTSFSDVLVKDVILFICDNYGLTIKFINNIMVFSRFVEPVPEKKNAPLRQLEIQYDRQLELLSFDLKNDTVASVLKTISQLSGKNVIAASDKILSKTISGFINKAPFQSAIEKMAISNAMTFQRTNDNFYILAEAVPILQMAGNNVRNSPQLEITVINGLLAVEAFGVPILDLIRQSAEKIGKEFVLNGTIEGVVTVNVKRMNFDQLLELIFRTTSYTYRYDDGVYVIGDRNQEGLRQVEVVRLEYRSIDGMEKEIPAELNKGVEIKVLKDLNSLVLTGSRPVIVEIKKFLLDLDKPVPNILIELMVIDLKKGFTIQTGIQAFLSDSIPKTQGKVFPGIDLTVSPQSINTSLAKLNDKGIINLGKVTPNFYMNLKALEDNSNIDIRSTPKLSTMNGHEATLTIGRSQYYVEQTQNVVGGVTPITTTAQRFNKVEANLNIVIKPVVSGNEHITLDFEAEFSDFIPATIQNAPPGNTTRKFKSMIRIRNGETLLFGGLEQESQSQNNSGIPLLSRIPGLKWLFSSRSKSNQRDQLIVLIKPTVVY